MGETKNVGKKNVEKRKIWEKKHWGEKKNWGKILEGENLRAPIVKP